MSGNRRELRNKQGNMKKRRRLVAWILTPILIIALSAAAYGAFLYNKAESVMNKSFKPVDHGQNNGNQNVENTSILFIGVDDSESRKFGGNSRSDALMLATFNKKDKSIKLLSIPRDSYVHIPERDVYTKITHAHAYGGVKLTLETVEELLGVPVNYYVKMNFNAFMDVIDALDGIKVDVPYTFTEQDSHDRKSAITLKKGLQTLNGEEALALARTRHYDNDILRGERQQEIFKAIISRGASVNSISKYSNVIEAIGKNMTTDLTFNQMKSFMNYLTAGTNLKIDSMTLKGSDSRIDGIYYWQLDKPALEETKSTLKKQLGIANDYSNN